jgi:hypothetical protein
MPCCPRSDGGMQSCSTAQCAEQVPEKAEGQNAAWERHTAAPGAVVLRAAASEPLAFPRRELRPGLRSFTGVFRLKDDLRI